MYLYFSYHDIIVINEYNFNIFNYFILIIIMFLDFTIIKFKQIIY